MGKRAVLFDLDGTLVDSNELHVEVWHQVFADAGHTVAPERIRGQIGKGGDKLVPALLPDLPEDEQERLADAHGELFKARFIQRVRPFPGARALLKRVAERAEVVLASSASKAELDHYTRLLDARDIVGASTSIDDVKESKPAPDIFATALKKAGADAADAVAVGDSPFDMESARRSGIRAVAVRSGGFDDRALTEAGAAAIYDDVMQILDRFDDTPLAPA